MRRDGRGIIADIAWGLGWSLPFFIMYSLIAIAVFVVSGPGKVPLSLPQLLAMYLVLAAASGLVVGLMRPLTRKKSGAVVVGIIVGCVIYLGAGISVAGIRVLREPGPIIALLLAACVVGGMSGAKWWKESKLLERR